MDNDTHARHEYKARKSDLNAQSKREGGVFQKNDPLSQIWENVPQLTTQLMQVTTAKVNRIIVFVIMILSLTCVCDNASASNVIYVTLSAAKNDIQSIKYAVLDWNNLQYHESDCRRQYLLHIQGEIPQKYRGFPQAYQEYT